MKNKIDFSILPTTISEGDYCNKYVELALNTDFIDSYNILESIYHLGRWYATRKSLKLFFGLSDSTLKRKLDILSNFGLIEYYELNTNNSYIKLTNNGASLVNKRIMKWNSSNKDIQSLLRKSDMIYKIASCDDICNLQFFNKNINRDRLIQEALSKYYITNYVKVSVLEQSHIYIFSCTNSSIWFAIDYSNTEEYIKDCVKIYEFLSSYGVVNNIKVNIVLLNTDKYKATTTLDDVLNDDFKKSFKVKLLKYFISKNINMDFDSFLKQIASSTKLLSY